MKKKRNRSRPPLPLQERLRQIAVGAREKAAGLPPGHERDRLLETAVSTESAAAIERWLSSPESQIGPLAVLATLAPFDPWFLLSCSCQVRLARLTWLGRR